MMVIFFYIEMLEIMARKHTPKIIILFQDKDFFPVL